MREPSESPILYAPITYMERMPCDIAQHSFVNGLPRGIAGFRAVLKVPDVSGCRDQLIRSLQTCQTWALRGFFGEYAGHTK